MNQNENHQLAQNRPERATQFHSYKVFIISVFLIITPIVCIRQIEYMESRPIGYVSSNLIDITADGDLPGRFDLFKTKASSISGVLDVGVCCGGCRRHHYSAGHSELSWGEGGPDKSCKIVANGVRGIMP